MFARAWRIRVVGVLAAVVVGGLGISTNPIARTQSAHLASRAKSASNSDAYRINWPDGNPVWSFYWVPPDESSGTDGSGLELRNVFYKGHLVLYRAHLPILNVKYDPGGCGGSSLSYRD